MHDKLNFHSSLNSTQSMISCKYQQLDFHVLVNAGTAGQSQVQRQLDSNSDVQLYSASGDESTPTIRQAEEINALGSYDPETGLLTPLNRAIKSQTTSNLLANQMAQQVPAEHELARYTTINTVINLIRAKLPAVKIGQIELLAAGGSNSAVGDATATKLAQLSPLVSCPLIFEHKYYGEIIADNAQILELIAYYLSETDTLKLPLAELPACELQANHAGHSLKLLSWQPVTLIERQSYLSASLEDSAASCNIYLSPELGRKLTLCEVTSATGANAVDIDENPVFFEKPIRGVPKPDEIALSVSTVPLDENAIPQNNHSYNPANKALVDFLVLLNQASATSFKLTNNWQARFNRMGNYLKIEVEFKGVAGYLLVDNSSYFNNQLAIQAKAIADQAPAGAGIHHSNSQPNHARCAKTYNSLAPLALSFPLTHGISSVTSSEVMALETGDVILFDDQLAPDYLALTFNNLSYKFKLVNNQLIFCAVN
jgi:hypothetical protein